MMCVVKCYTDLYMYLGRYVTVGVLHFLKGGEGGGGGGGLDGHK